MTVSLLYVPDMHVSDFRFQEDDMILDKVQDVMVADSLATSHPVFMPADTPAQISAIFDSITYDKVSARSLHCSLWNVLPGLFVV